MYFVPYTGFGFSIGLQHVNVKKCHEPQVLAQDGLIFEHQASSSQMLKHSDEAAAGKQSNDNHITDYSGVSLQSAVQWVETRDYCVVDQNIKPTERYVCQGWNLEIHCVINHQLKVKLRKVD